MKEKRHFLGIFYLTLVFTANLLGQESHPIAKISIDEKGNVRVVEQYMENFPQERADYQGRSKEKMFMGSKDGSAIPVDFQMLEHQKSKAKPDQAMNPGPDLDIDYAGTNMSWTNPILTINVRVINNGTTTAGYSYVGYYLSTNLGVSTSD